jgi:hypothetical protein
MKRTANVDKRVSDFHVGNTVDTVQSDAGPKRQRSSKQGKANVDIQIVFCG